jgi:predicted ATPase
MATHSPILAALAGATLLTLTRGGIELSDYEDTECVLAMKAFLDKRLR